MQFPDVCVQQLTERLDGITRCGGRTQSLTNSRVAHTNSRFKLSDGRNGWVVGASLWGIDPFALPRE